VASLYTIGRDFEGESNWFRNTIRRNVGSKENTEFRKEV